VSDIVNQVPNQCQRLHRMNLGVSGIVPCILPADHEGDCLITYGKTYWRVSPHGYHDHPPIIQTDPEELAQMRLGRDRDQQSLGKMRPYDAAHNKRILG
jgi:hypothetical protein